MHPDRARSPISSLAGARHVAIIPARYQSTRFPGKPLALIAGREVRRIRVEALPKLKGGLRAKGYSEEFGDRIFRQILGFGEYGFPESHAASFALLVYVSAWLKRHEPAAFCCALLNSQPMGFYSASQLVQDAQRHGVSVLPVDVCCSDWESTLRGAFAAAGTALNTPREKLMLVVGEHATERVVC